jgi:hypothetical protein
MSQADDSAKSYIPAIAYMFGAGPYWKCYARLGFDPRQNPEYRMYVLPLIIPRLGLIIDIKERTSTSR